MFWYDANNLEDYNACCKDVAGIKLPYTSYRVVGLYFEGQAGDVLASLSVSLRSNDSNCTALITPLVLGVNYEFVVGERPDTNIPVLIVQLLPAILPLCINFYFEFTISVNAINVILRSPFYQAASVGEDIGCAKSSIELYSDFNGADCLNYPDNGILNGFWHGNLSNVTAGDAAINHRNNIGLWGYPRFNGSKFKYKTFDSAYTVKSEKTERYVIENNFMGEPAARWIEGVVQAGEIQVYDEPATTTKYLVDGEGVLERNDDSCMYVVNIEYNKPPCITNKCPSVGDGSGCIGLELDEACPLEVFVDFAVYNGSTAQITDNSGKRRIELKFLGAANATNYYNAFIFQYGLDKSVFVAVEKGSLVYFAPLGAFDSIDVVGNKVFIYFKKSIPNGYEHPTAGAACQAAVLSNGSAVNSFYNGFSAGLTEPIDFFYFVEASYKARIINPNNCEFVFSTAPIVPYTDIGGNTYEFVLGQGTNFISFQCFASSGFSTTNIGNVIQYKL